jgi:3-hydroxyisobutyrate dehydrogenase-like beta-hydroxyacid dehydrogenase
VAIPAFGSGELAAESWRRLLHLSFKGETGMGDVLDVGFIGLGNMGVAMARNLIKARHRVTVYNRTRVKAEALATEGARVAERIADACWGAVVITMLADDAAVEAVLFGDRGIGRSLAAGAIHVSMSTISIALSERMR